MKKRVVFLMSVFLLAGSFSGIAFAKSYGVDVTSADAEIRIPVGVNINHTFTVKNTGELQDTYLLSVKSIVGWVDEGSIPDLLPLAPGESRAITVTIFVTSTTTKSTRGTVELQAMSINDDTFFDSATVDIQLEGAPLVALITGPTEGARGEKLSFTFSSVDEESLAKDDFVTYQIDWDGHGTVDQTDTGRAKGKTMRHTYLESGTFVIRVTARDDTYGGTSEATHTIVIEGEAEDVEYGYRPSSRIPQKAPCTDTSQGIERFQCLFEFRRFASDRGSREDVRTRRLLRGTVGRRLAALRARATFQRTYFVPRTPYTLGITDPRPAEERMQGFPTRRSRINAHLANRAKGRLSAFPLLKSTAKAANRLNAKIPLCSKTDGIRRIGCLLDLGIEINEQTADPKTLEIWERIRSELGWLFP